MLRIVAGLTFIIPAFFSFAVYVITMVGESRTCAPFLDPNGFCNFWTGRAGTKVVLKTTADPPFANHHWIGDCTGTGDCKLTMDSNKAVVVIWET
jgi:hypothetical protein